MKNKDYYNYKIVFVVLILILTIAAVIMTLYMENQDYQRNNHILNDNTNIIRSEPILEINLDEINDKITIKNKTMDYFEIENLSFGKIKPIVYLEKNNYRAVDLLYMRRDINFNDKDKTKDNKYYEIHLSAEDYTLNEHDFYNIKTVIRDFDYLDKFNDYYYLIAHYKDANENINTQYYIFDNDNFEKIEKHKLSNEEFMLYTSQTLDTRLILKDINEKNIDFLELENILSSEKSRIDKNNLKYYKKLYKEVDLDFPYGIK